MLQLEELLERKPAQLSGGQRQRVAIGRALVREPQVFLFDEPLSNLDAMLRVQMRVEIAKLHQDLSATMIYVTHDQVEAMTLADKIVVLDRGVISQVGTPMELYQAPANKFVASFIGSPTMNFVAAKLKGAEGQNIVVDLPGGHDLTVKTRKAVGKGHTPSVEVGIRPEHVQLAPAGRPAGEPLRHRADPRAAGQRDDHVRRHPRRPDRRPGRRRRAHQRRRECRRDLRPGPGARLSRRRCRMLRSSLAAVSVFVQSGSPSRRRAPPRRSRRVEHDLAARGGEPSSWSSHRTFGPSFQSSSSMDSLGEPHQPISRRPDQHGRRRRSLRPANWSMQWMPSMKLSLMTRPRRSSRDDLPEASIKADPQEILDRPPFP